MTEQELKEFLRKSVEQTWAATAEPYLLSYVANDLKAQDQDYRSALNEDERLKTFAQRVQNSDHLFKVIQHPLHKAKVGLIPYDQDYVFPVEAREDRKAGAIRSRTRNEVALLGFFDALQALPDDVLDTIHIPTKAIVLLLRNK